MGCLSCVREKRIDPTYLNQFLFGDRYLNETFINYFFIRYDSFRNHDKAQKEIVHMIQSQLRRVTVNGYWKNDCSNDEVISSLTNQIWDNVNDYYKVRFSEIPDFFQDEVKRLCSKQPCSKNNIFAKKLPIQQKSKKSSSESKYFFINSYWMAERTPMIGAVRRKSKTFVEELSKREKTLIETFKQAIRCNFLRNEDLVFKYVYKSKEDDFKKRTEYTEITYKDLKDVIDDEYLSDNIGTYYMCLLQEREYRYKKKQDDTHCVFLNSIQFNKVKYPMNQEDHHEVKRYLLSRHTLAKINFLPKNCELYILNNINENHFICYKVYRHNKRKRQDYEWELNEYDSLYSGEEEILRIPDTKSFKEFLKFLGLIFDGFKKESLQYSRKKSQLQHGQPNCLLFSLFNIETFSAIKPFPKFSSKHAEKKDVFLISLLDMKLMSERYQLPDKECDRISGLLQSDINSKDEKIALSDKEEDEDEVEVIKEVQVLNNRDQEEDHVKYFGYNDQMIELSQS